MTRKSICGCTWIELNAEVDHVGNIRWVITAPCLSHNRDYMAFEAWFTPLGFYCGREDQKDFVFHLIGIKPNLFVCYHNGKCSCFLKEKNND